ncbi:MAG TPA: VOC family protein [Desertimonas sp.]|jgi:predicted enzyme related to lactoylglutathione lyase|nr:VOC family protein [Desertimonas sp.]
MITAVHTLVYADDADRARNFFRDVLNWPSVDAGGGWLIFKTGPSEMGVHPTDHALGQHHQISLMCDDIEATVADLRDRGVEITQDVRDDGFGLTAIFVVPGGGDMMIYQPRHPSAYDLA